MRKRVIGLLFIILFAGFFITGCFAKDSTQEEDPWEIYKVSKSDARLRNWMRYYLVKDNKQHYLFMDYSDPIAISTKGGYLVYSDIPAFVFEDGDSFRYYYSLGGHMADRIRVVKVNPPTGALNIQFEYLFDKSGKFTLKEFYSFVVLEEDSMITDMNGNEIGDVWNNMYNLNIDETYKISVMEETGLYEEELTADWLFYSCDDFDDEIIIHPDLSNRKYATYDLSSLEPGYYCIINGVYNIIEIK